jgi:hypothetical protein
MGLGFKRGQPPPTTSDPAAQGRVQAQVGSFSLLDFPPYVEAFRTPPPAHGRSG